MPDTRTHRGPHPHDAELFRDESLTALREAVRHLSWLLTRGYAEPSSLKLVGDRFNLTHRQRLAVLRSSCSDRQLEHRRRRRIPVDQLRGGRLAIDGFNLLTTIEAALSGGVLLRGRDGCTRDMASMHGSYRKVAETVPALKLIGGFLADCGAAAAVWHLDRPVSNSGRLLTIIRDLAATCDWNWTVELHDDPDAVLSQSSRIVATADSLILDRCRRWSSLATDVVDAKVPGAWIVALDE